MRASFCAKTQLLSLCVLVLVLVGVPALAQEVGVPVTGDMGITVTVEALSRRGALSVNADAAVNRIRPLLPSQPPRAMW